MTRQVPQRITVVYVGQDRVRGEPRQPGIQPAEVR